MTEQEAFGISKKEEDFGVQLIIKKFIPYAVRIHNDRARYPEDIIEIKDAIRGLRKTEDSWDEKVYQSKTFAGTLTFGMSKRHKASYENPEKGELTIGDFNLTTRSMWYWHTDDKLLPAALRGLMKEVTHEDVKNFGISKQEEELGYQLIIKELVPEMVKQYNELIRKHQSGGLRIYKNVTPQQVIRNFVKVRREYDVVEYASRQSFGPIEFGIRKKRYPVHEGDIPKPQLAVGYWQLDPPVYHGTSWVWIPIENLMGYDHDEDAGELNEEKTGPFHITKEEEDKALEYILRNFSKDYTEKLGRKLRKTKHERNQFGDLIEYSAWMDGDWNGFLVKKIEDFDGIKLMVGRIYKDYGDPDVWFNISLGAPEPIEPWSALEEIIGSEETQRRVINKFEEEQALDFLRKVVIPKAVQQYNREIKTNPYVKYLNYKPTNVADVSRNLRKIRVSKYSDRNTRAVVVGSDVIEFESKIPPGHIFGFFIDKANGLYASYESPFEATKHCFKVGGHYF